MNQAAEGPSTIGIHGDGGKRVRKQNVAEVTTRAHKMHAVLLVSKEAGYVYKDLVRERCQHDGSVGNQPR